MKEPQLFFDVMLHFGTLLAVAIYFRKDLRDILRAVGSTVTGKRNPDEGTKLFFLILVASIPTGLMGILFQDWFQTLFAQPKTAGGMLLVTGSFLFLTRWVRKEGRPLKEMRWTDALFIGVAQGIAIIPGISRSGATISMGLFFGLNRELSGRFSFLMSIPAILGATFLELREVDSILELQAASMGAAIAFLTGLLSLAFLMKVVQKGKLHHFSYYCWGIGVIMILSIGNLKDTLGP